VDVRNHDPFSGRALAAFYGFRFAFFAEYEGRLLEIAAGFFERLLARLHGNAGLLPERLYLVKRNNHAACSLLILPIEVKPLG
jgi:hypothetical protein